MAFSSFRIVVVLSACILLCGNIGASEPRSPYLGPSEILVAEDPDVLYILEQDARQIRKIRVDAENPEQGRPELLALPFRPERMRLFPDKRRLAVVGGAHHGSLLIVDLKSFRISAEIPVGHTPSDAAIRPSDDPSEPVVVYVANRFDGDISVIELAEDVCSGKEIKRMPAGREPITLAVTPDGKDLIVVGHLPEDPATDFGLAARVRFIDTRTEHTTTIRLTAGAMNLRDIILTPDGRYAFITGLIGHFERIPDSVGGGWMNENLLHVIDVPGRKIANLFYVDEMGIGSGNPRGVSLSDDERFLVVAAAGSCDVILFNLAQYVATLDQDASSNSRTGYPSKESKSLEERLSANLPIQMRIPIGLKGVRFGVMTKNRIFTTSYFEDSVARIDPVFTEPLAYSSGLHPKDYLEIPRNKIKNIRSDVTTPIRTNFRPSPEQLEEQARLVDAASVETKVDSPLHFLPLPEFRISPGIYFKRSFARLGPEPDWTEVRYGEMLFHDAIPCLEHWQSCSSCHPAARSDTLNWDLLNDGWDNPKNSKSLLLSHETPPCMATAIRKDAETAVRKGFESILFVDPTEEEACAVDEYLKNLKPVPSPRLVFDRTKKDDSGTFNEAAKRGRRIFNSNRSGCGSCHPDPLFTDMLRHDVGTQSIRDMRPSYDTPTLIEIWRTAPYLHDGRYTTIRELIVEGKHVNTDGRLDALTDEEIDDLVEYILSL